MKNILVRIPLITAAFVTLVGCVVGQSLDIDYEATSTAVPLESRGISVTLSVEDERPYVLSAEKPRYYIGQYRAGFGIPYDVSTEGEVPLAELLHQDMSEELVSLGFSIAENSSDRGLQLTVRDWDFDTYQNGTFSYSIDVLVFGQNGNQLIEAQVEKNEYVQGTFWTGGRGGFERAMPGLYDGVIKSLIRENTEVLSALD